MKTLFYWLLSFFWLAPAAGWACAFCRPRVQAAIHNADYSVNVALLLLPVALLLVLGLGLYYADALWPKWNNSFFVVRHPLLVSPKRLTKSE